MVVTYNDLYNFMQGNEDVNLHKAFIILIKDYHKKIKSLVGDENCWINRFVSGVSEKRVGELLLRDPANYFSDVSYAGVPIEMYMGITAYNMNQNSDKYSIAAIYGLDETRAHNIWLNIVSAKYDKNNNSEIKPAGAVRQYRHDIIGHRGENKEGAAVDLIPFINTMKSFLPLLPYEAIGELHNVVKELLETLHSWWENIPQNERGQHPDWSVDYILHSTGKKGDGYRRSDSVSESYTHNLARPTPVSRSNPQYLIFLVDESGSMESKGNQVVSALNNTLEHLKRTQRKGSAGTKNYFYVSILGYRRFMNDSTQEIEVAVEDLVKYNSNTPTNIRKEKIRPLIAVTHKDYTTRNDWVKFEAYGGTPMKEAFAVCKELVGNWEINADRYISEANPGLKADEKLHPPIIINITDGRYDDSMSGEGNLDVSKSPAGIIREIQSRKYQRFYDKPVVMNVHITDVGGTDTTAFPSSVSSNAEPYLRELFSMSSLLTENQVLSAQNGGYAVSSGAKAFLYNANPADLTKILIIGTQRTQPTVTGRTTIPEDLGF